MCLFFDAMSNQKNDNILIIIYMKIFPRFSFSGIFFNKLIIVTFLNFFNKNIQKFILNAIVVVALLFSFQGVSAQTVTKQLYLSNGESLDTIVPEAISDAITITTGPLSLNTQGTVPYHNTSSVETRNSSISFTYVTTTVDNRYILVGVAMNIKSHNSRIVNSISYGGQALKKFHLLNTLYV